MSEPSESTCGARLGLKTLEGIYNVVTSAADVLADVFRCAV